MKQALNGVNLYEVYCNFQPRMEITVSLGAPLQNVRIFCSPEYLSSYKTCSSADWLLETLTGWIFSITVRNLEK